MKTLYVKYSDVNRKDKYKIKTQIMEENGRKYVLKEALSEEALEHIYEIANKKQKLEIKKFIMEDLYNA